MWYFSKEQYIKSEKEINKRLGCYKKIRIPKWVNTCDGLEVGEFNLLGLSYVKGTTIWVLKDWCVEKSKDNIETEVKQVKIYDVKHEESKDDDLDIDYILKIIEKKIKNHKIKAFTLNNLSEDVFDVLFQMEME